MHEEGGMNWTLIQRAALYGTLGTLLSQGLDIQWDDVGFWCVLALFWAADTIARRDGYEVGVVQGIDIYRNMSTEQRSAVDTIYKDTE
jgi:hypothetical protein